MNSTYRSNLKAIAQANKNYTDTKVATLQNQLDVANAEIANLKQASSGNTYTETSLSGVANVLTLDANTLPTARVNKLGGMSYKSSNKFVIPDIAEHTTSDITWKVENGVFYLNGTASASFSINLLQYCTLTTNVTIKFFDIQGTSSKSSISQINGNYSAPTTSGTTISNLTVFRFYTDANQSFTNYSFKVMVVSGSTAPTEWSEGFTGLRHSPMTSVDVLSRNIWDEEWQTGSIDKASGGNVTSTKTLRSKNFNECIPNTTYYFSHPSVSSGYYAVIFYYDANYNYISYTQNNANFSSVAPSNARYFKIAVELYIQDYTTYKNDICVNASDSQNGTYTPYSSATYTMPSSITSLDGYGMGVNSSVYNYIDLVTAKTINGVATTKSYVKNSRSKKISDLSWSFSSTYNRFYTQDLTDIKIPSTNETLANLLASGYESVTATAQLNDTTLDMTIALSSTNYLGIRNTSYNGDVEAFLAGEGNNEIVYELATPIETDISDYIGDLGLLDNVYLTDLEGSGTIEFANTYNQDIPYDLTTYVKVV